jgi:hypothetical protein
MPTLAPAARAVARAVARSAAIIALLSAGLCDAPTSAGDGVAAVQMTAVPTNPRVGETTIIGATPVGPGGLAVVGVPCTFASSNEGVLDLSDNLAGASGIGVSVGDATVTATCGSKSNAVEITVRPPVVTFAVTTPGDGYGSVFLNPPGGSYDAGTTVTATATALEGSLFAGWGGACAAAGVSSQCQLTLNSSETATATFALIPEAFVGMTVTNTPLGSLTDWAGCQYAITATPALALAITTNGMGQLGGSSSGGISIGITVSVAPPGISCFASPFSHVLSGTVSGTNADVTITAVSAGGNHSLTFSGSRSGDTITGTLTLQTLLSDGVSDFPMSTVISPYTLSKP